MQFTVLSGPDAGRTLVIRGNQGVIGRGPDKEFPLSDPRVSRAHAVVENSGSGSTVRDLGSTHGVYLRGARLEVGIPVALQPGDELRLGDTVLRYDGRATQDQVGPDSGSSQPVRRLAEGRSQRLLALAAVAALTFIVVVVVLAFASGRLFTSTSQPDAVGLTTAAAATRPQTATATIMPAIVFLTPTTAAVASTVTPAVRERNTPATDPPTMELTPGSLPRTPTPSEPPRPGNPQAEQIPQAVARLFPGVPPAELPQAIMNAARNGELSPDQIRSVLNALFPGVSSRDLPRAIVRAFPSIPIQDLRQLLDQAFAGQGLTIPSVPPLSGTIYVGVFGDGKYQIIEVNTQNNTRQILIDNASEPALSPDHTWLAYYSWRSDARGLRLRHLVTGADNPLTDRAQDAYPSWSPNQDRLALHDSEDGTVLTINRDGTDRRVVGKGEFASWSPRGDEIAYKGCLSGGDCGIILVRPDGAQRQRLTTNANDGQPAWSPDGNSLTFVSNRDGNWEIYAINRDGSWLRRITSDAATDGLPEFAPDGLRIAFRSDRQGAWAVWVALGLGGPAIKLFDANAGPTWQYEKIAWR